MQGAGIGRSRRKCLKKRAMFTKSKEIYGFYVIIKNIMGGAHEANHLR